MSQNPRHKGGALVVAAVLAIVGKGDLARGQDLAEVEGEEERALNHRPRIVVTREIFDQVVFGNRGGFRQAEKNLNEVLQYHAAATARLRGLTEAEKRKIVLAGRADIKHLIERAHETERNFPIETDDIVKYREFWIREIGPLQNASRDPFGDGSMFSKTLHKVLNDKRDAIARLTARERLMRYRETDQQTARERLMRHRATVRWFAGTAGTTLRLSPEQRRRFETLLLEETRPPRRFGTDDYYGLMCQVAKIPQAKLKPIFDDAQWGTLASQLAHAREMEPLLREGGFVPEDEAVDTPSMAKHEPAQRKRE